MQAFAQAGEPLLACTPLQQLERLASETQGLTAETTVQWQTRGELRPRASADDEVWLHLDARADVPMVCQRCMATVVVPIDVDQWYRFVATEDIAMAQDDECEEDLLVMAPQFDLLALVEDELLMALPLVPMHESCPAPPAFSTEPLAESEPESEKPHPFAALAVLKKK